MVTLIMLNKGYGLGNILFMTLWPSFFLSALKNPVGIPWLVNYLPNKTGDSGA